MAEYYRASFTVDSPNDAPEARGLDLLVEVEAIVRAWAWDEDRFGKTPREESTGDWTNDKGATLHIGKDQLEKAGFWELVLEHPDDEDAFKWRTDFRLATEGEGVEVEVGVRRIDGGDELTTQGGSASRPRVLVTLFEKFECSFDGKQLATEAEKVTQKNAANFVHDVVLNASRRMPVVVVTENRYGGTYMGANYLQSRLLGLANVFAYDNETAKAVNEYLSDWLRCWEGTMRVYRPGCSADDASQQNAFWSWRRMAYIGWETVILEVGDECLIRSLPQAGPQLYDEVSGRVRQAQYERLQERLKNAESAAEDASEYQELLNDATSTIDNYKRENDELRQKNDELQYENKRLQSQVGALSYQDSSDSEPEEVSDDIPPEPAFDSVRQVVEYAAKRFDGLRFFPHAVELAKRSPFPRPSDVYRVFTVLDECASERKQGPLGTGVKEWMKNKGVKYATGESEQTMNKHGEKPNFWDEEKKRRVEMQEHIKLGGGSGENHQLRIHIFWEEDEKKWLIGYIGQHLPTATR